MSINYTTTLRIGYKIKEEEILTRFANPDNDKDESFEMFCRETGLNEVNIGNCYTDESYSFFVIPFKGTGEKSDYYDTMPYSYMSNQKHVLDKVEKKLTELGISFSEPMVIAGLFVF